MFSRPLTAAALAAAPDARLVVLTRAGDEDAFAAIVDRYRAPLARYCRRYLAPSSAEDALQQTFINAHAALSEGTLPLALKPWLYRIARNAALNIARGEPVCGPVPDDLLGFDEPEDVFARREAFASVVGGIQALPRSQREVIVRHAFAGDSHEEIATDLGMSAGAIRQLAYRARGTLRAVA
jgi:RNA polymerase sigma factor (sigma-70 family)